MRRGWLLVLLTELAACGPTVDVPDIQRLQREVVETEQSFARTMAERDHAAFVSFLSSEAVFFAGDMPLRGAQAVADAWSRYFEGDLAPFSWAPETVEVLASGMLALSSGSVRDADGTLIGTFNSIWRRDPDGRWRIVFDKGCGAACDCR
jgi:ketosteroid isomerase-like protein